MPVKPVRVAVANDYELVVAGLAAMLAPFDDRVQVVELDSSMPVASEVDVVLFDTFAQGEAEHVDLDELLGGQDAKVVVYSWNVDPEVVARTLRRGATGYLSKGAGAEEVVAALEQAADGHVVRPDADTDPGTDQCDEGAWPGREQGLSPREAEILALITQGLSNQEIAERTYLSINSVKTYIRTAYRKVGVTRRAQAVAWGMSHGFTPDRVRRVAAVD